MSLPPTPPDTAPAPAPASPETPADLVATSLREPESLGGSLAHEPRLPLRLLALLLPAMAGVGLLIASFAGGAQFLAVPIKVVVGTAIAMVVCLPSLFVFSNLTGTRVRLPEAIAAMTLSVAVLSFVLLALAPIALIFSLSTDSEVVVGWIHVLFLLVASWFGGAALRRVWLMREPSSTAGSDAPSERRGTSASIWMMLFVVVLLQLSTTLRPLVGPYAPIDLADKKIFLQHWFGSERDDVVAR